MRLRLWKSKANPAGPAFARLVEVEEGAEMVPIVPSPGVEFATYIHCDVHILHSPGVCRFCDAHPEMQAYRVEMGVAFSDQSGEEVEALGLRPCPSTRGRSAEARDRWPANRPSEGFIQ